MPFFKSVRYCQLVCDPVLGNIREEVWGVDYGDQDWDGGLWGGEKGWNEQLTFALLTFSGMDVRGMVDIDEGKGEV